MSAASVAAILAFVAALLPAARWIAFFGVLACAIVLVVQSGRLSFSYEEVESDARKADRRSEFSEREMRRHREVVDALADGLEVAIFLCGERSIVEYANRRAVELFRFEAPAGRNILAVTLSNELGDLVGRATESGEPQHAEIQFRFPEERVALAKAWCDPSDPLRTFVTLQEITSLRKLERVRRDFVANVSHELRTPMTSLRAMAETLHDADQQELQDLSPRYLTKMIEEIDRLNMITEDLLTLTSAESNPVDKRPCDLAALARAAVDTCADRAEAKELRLTLSAPDSLPVSANPHQITQVLVNLIDNAIKYTPSGSVAVMLEETPEAAIVRVQDTGIGIPEEHQARIFERFYRVDAGRNRQTGGTGLGLSIVKHIVESHGGKVTVQSLSEVGTTFTITLPKGSA